MNKPYAHRSKRTRRKPALLLWLALHLGILTTAAQADSIIVYDEEHPLLYEDAWDLWPYSFLNENGEPDGYNIDLLKILFKKLDIPYIVKLKPTNEALADLKSGKSDLMMGMDANFHHEFGSYGKTVLNLFTHSVLHRKGQPPVIGSIDDLGQHRVIVHEGSFSHHLMQDLGWGDNAIPYDDMKEAIQEASVNAEHEVVWNTMSLKWLINKYQISNLELSPIDIPHGEYKFISNNQRLLAQLDSVYALLSAEERLQPLQNKWFYPERQESGLPSWIWKLAVLLAVASAGSLTYYLFYRARERKMTKELKRKNARLALILKTSGARFWTYNIPSKTFTWMDQNGNPVRNLSIQEFSRRYRQDSFEGLIKAINQLVRQESESTVLETHALKEADSGDERDFTVTLSVLRRHKNGKPSVIIGTRSDITEERKQELKTRNLMLRYQAIFDSSMIDMVYFDKDGLITEINNKALRMLPVSIEQIREHRITIIDILGLDGVTLENIGYMYLTQIYKSDDDPRPLNQLLRQKELYYEMQLVPLRDERGRLLGIFGTGRNVTEIATTYHQLKENNSQLQAANDEMHNYIQNINNVLRLGGIRIVNYDPETHMLSIYNEIGHAQYALTQTRAIMLTAEESRKAAQRLLTSMDNRTQAPIATTLKSTLRQRGGKALYLQLHFIPMADAKGNITSYFGLCRDNSDIKNTEKELEKETLRAQEVEVVKNAFLRNMSYEIRTPLNTVVGFAELFQMEHSSEDESVFIEEIKDNSRSLLRLINNILFLSRLDAKMIEIKPQLTDFAQLFDITCHNCWETLQQPGVSYRVESPYEQLCVEVDAQNLSIVVEQIVTNACQHTTEGSVRCRIEYIGDQLILAVDDTGCGIAEEHLPTIFERFSTGGNTGSGLGLSICHELMRQMGGSINIKSKVGKGTTVWVALPCRATDVVRK